MSLNFLRYGGGSTEIEWNELWAARPRTLVQIMAHLAAVDAAAGIGENRPLSHAERLEGSAAADLYWYKIDDVCVVYAYDGHQLVIASLGLSDAPHTRSRLVTLAAERIAHAQRSPA
jgi:hypothetical protein